MTQAHAQPTKEISEELGVDPDKGLRKEEVLRRRRKYGPNRLRKAARKSIWAILIGQFRSLIVWLLGGAATLSFIFGEWTEGAAIVAVLVINAAIGFTSELKAVRSMEALRGLSRVRARVRRDGQEASVAAEELVPGDVVLVEGGNIVPADVRLLESANLEADESALTGESVPVAKGVEPVEKDAPLAERTNVVFKGTALTRGAGLGVAVATGMKTELGNIAELAETAEAQVSPLERRLDRLGGQLVWATLGLTAIIAATGIYAGHDLLAMVKTAIALAVAAVPEGLPVVATIVLARGMWRMAQRNALIKNLSAVETLGATTVILADKTGTLTENRMTVARLHLGEDDVQVEPESAGGRSAFSESGNPYEPAEDTALYGALRVAVLCNNAELADDREDENAPKGVGDPMELALLEAGRAAGIERAALLETMPKLREEAFSTDTKMMATFHRTEDGCLVAVKGAPEAVIACCSHCLAESGPKPMDEASRGKWRDRNEEMAGDGLRVLALAMKQAASQDEAPYENLTLLGLAGLLDPPRADVSEAISGCRAAGVRVVMLTGDHAGTARNVAVAVGLAEKDARAYEASALKELQESPEEERGRVLEAAIFARVSPETKLDLVTLFQQGGEIVAMTGDGVNDAPALKKADIGIAMGQRGTEVAREAADMVLRDDAFPSIVAAMHQGRVIFGNIRKFVLYLMSCNASEILVIGLATLGGLPLPLLPLQILYLNLVTDVFPAFALGAGEGDPDIMRRPPRDPQDPILGREQWLSIGLYSALITAATLGAFIVALTSLGMTEEAALTISFLTLAFAQLWHVFNMRGRDAGPVRNEITGNPYVWGALAICIALILAAVYAPGLSEVLRMTPPDTAGWALVAAGSLIPLVLGPLVNLIVPYGGGHHDRGTESAKPA